MAQARLSYLIGSLLLGGLCAGCAAQKPAPSVAAAPPNNTYNAVTVAPLTVSSGVMLDNVLRAQFTRDLEDALAGAGYNLAPEAALPPRTVEVRCNYLAYYPGSQLKYFTLGVPPIALPGIGTMVTDGSYIPPGLGATIFGYSKATVAVALIDKDSGANLGTMTVTRAIPPNQVGTGTIEPVNQLIQYELANSTAQAVHQRIKPS